MVNVSYKIWKDEGAWCLYRKEEGREPFSRLYILLGEYPTKKEAKDVRKRLSSCA